MMEANPLEAVRNNVLATKVVAEVAVEFGVERFVLDLDGQGAQRRRRSTGSRRRSASGSSRPTARARTSPTRFVAVRFGNVLDSAGSVIRIFKRQIAKGGPVTVTHPEMTRYFMTTPEAVSLVIQAGAIGGRGEIFVLDMGEPVKILDLAHNMIRLSGKEPDREIPIEFIGARPGEKLHEELWGEDEIVGETEHPKIKRARRAPVDGVWLEEELARAGAARRGGRDARGRVAALDDGAGAAPARRAQADTVSQQTPLAVEVHVGAARTSRPGVVSPRAQ